MIDNENIENKSILKNNNITNKHKIASFASNRTRTKFSEEDNMSKHQHCVAT